jgi:endonuclease/exonuclease/phosphatase family metal-dependent hydrolase
MTVCGTHMSHITHGSHAQYRRLSKQLPPVGSAAVLAGDMNLWGPPTASYFRGWRRAVRGRSWPAHRPHSQLDHVLVTRSVTASNPRIGGFAGSDHRPAVVTLGLAPPQAGTGR